MAKRGHSRDGTPGEPQVEFGLLTNAEGIPVAIEAFAGNTGDPATFPAQEQKVRERFGVGEVVWVAHRGMLTSAQVEQLQEVVGARWITALRAPTIQQLRARSTTGALGLMMAPVGGGPCLHLNQVVRCEIPAEERNMIDLKGKVAIVTGAGRLRGIGHSTALALARAGADVVITGTGRRPETFPADEQKVGWRDIESVADEIRVLGRRVLPSVVDISKSDQVNDMVQRTIMEFGRIDILVNNAAHSRGPDRVPVVEISEDVWRKVIDVDINGTFLVSRAVAQQLIRQDQGGRIVNISSGSGKRGLPNRAAYVTGKFGIVGFTQALAWELGPHKINVNCICPGTIDTARVDVYGRGEEWERYVRGKCALGRAGNPDEIAGLVLFLCSPAADFIVGQSINMDGGQVMH